MQKTNAAGLELIRFYEGCSLSSYLCPAGKLTVGFGHTGADVFPGQTISMVEAEGLLEKDLGRFERGVTGLLKVSVNENEFAALVSFAFNLGLGALASSTLLAHLNAGRREDAANEFGRWNKITRDGGRVVMPGLVRRRAAEAALFRRPIRSTPAVA